MWRGHVHGQSAVGVGTDEARGDRGAGRRSAGCALGCRSGVFGDHRHAQRPVRVQADYRHRPGAACHGHGRVPVRCQHGGVRGIRGGRLFGQRRREPRCQDGADAPVHGPSIGHHAVDRRQLRRADRSGCGRGSVPAVGFRHDSGHCAGRVRVAGRCAAVSAVPAAGGAARPSRPAGAIRRGAASDMRLRLRPGDGADDDVLADLLAVVAGRADVGLGRIRHGRRVERHLHRQRGVHPGRPVPAAGARAETRAGHVDPVQRVPEFRAGVRAVGVAAVRGGARRVRPTLQSR